MRSFLFAVALLFSFHSTADQLAYISKAEAEKAAAYINKHKNIVLFCGCCSLVEPLKVKVIRAEAVYTGYENYYEVTIHYLDDDGQEVNENIDLAYVWVKKLFKYKTLGKIFRMDHDPCVYLKDWDNPEYIEKDI